jgi:large repetitive protein
LGFCLLSGQKSHLGCSAREQRPDPALRTRHIEVSDAMAMDYEATEGSEAETAFGTFVPDMVTSAAGLARTGAIQLVPGPGNVVVLPEGATLDDIAVRGRDLVIQLDDGRIYVITDGAVYVPEIVVDGVAIPPLNFAALLTGNEPEPAAGGVNSSGGNFAEAVDPIQAAFDLGNLLPYTELAFPQPQEREIIPAKPDRLPEVLIEGNGPASIDAIDSVSEVGLPGTRTNGNIESPGSLTGNGADTTTGTIIIASPDGIAQITINGTVITGTAGQQIVTDRGVLTLGALAGGEIGYSYRLTDNTAGDTTADLFAVAVTDLDGDLATASLTINIVDDVPTARNDTDSVAVAAYGPESGNVLSGSGTTSGVAGADTRGADGAVVSGIHAGTSGGFEAAGTTIAGQYGVLTLEADGSYSYVRNAGTPGGVSDVFTYQLTDGDGDTSTATLTISIADSPVTLDLPAGDDAGTQVDEAGLAAGSNAAASSETTAGTIAYVAPDGPATVTIDGVAVTGVGQAFVGSYGTLTITGIASGAISYSYTLTTNTAGDATFDDFAVVVTDQDGDTAPGTLVIDIIDDVPTARADTDSVTEDTAITADGNVITGSGGVDVNATDGVADNRGADGASVTAVSFGASPGTVGGPTAGTYGTLTLNADGSYSYALNNTNPVIQGLDANDTLTEVFTYTLTDGDGDVRQTTLTVTINGSDDPITINGLNPAGPDLIVDEDDLSDGSSPSAAALTQSGTFTVNGVDGIAGIAIQGTAVSVGQTFTTAHGYFTITSVSAPADGNATSIAIGYSYTLTDNTAHANGSGQNFLTESFAVTVVDTDGSAASDTVEVRIIDDVPTAVNDTDTIAGGSNAPATGNVITDAETDGGRDTQGADGAIVTAITGAAAGTVGGTTAGTYGVLALDADGSYSYTRDSGSPGNVSDVFTYTITDADGDSSTATLTITIEDASPVVGTNLAALLDDDALVGGNLGGIGDDIDSQNLTGTLSGSGGDGALTWAFQTTGSPAGFIYTLNGTALEVHQGSTLVLTITLDSATGAYVVTQNAPIMHAVGADENNQPFTLGYTVTDVDGDSAAGTLGINVDDDTPLAANDTDAVTEDGPITATGNVLSGAGSDGNAAGADSIGADGAAAGGAVTAIAGGTIGLPLAGSYGSLTLDATGGYTYTLNSALAAVQALDSGETLGETFTYTITDWDGDSTTATLSITINGANDAPIALADTNWTTEDAVEAIRGNVLATLAHNGAPDAALRGDVADTDVDIEPLTVTTTGSFNGSYGILTLNADGSYSYALYTQERNPAAYALIQSRDTGDAPLNDVFAYTASDGTASANSSLTIAVFGANDAPVAGTGMATVSEEGLANGIPDTTGVSDTTDSPTASGTIPISDVDIEPSIVTLGDPGAVLTAGGQPVTWSGIGSGTLIGSVGATEVIRITISNTGAYTVTLSQPVDHPTINVEDIRTFVVPVSVSDGTVTVPTTLTITIEDDRPIAVDDDQTAIEGVATVGGNVLDNDQTGADTAVAVTTTGTFNLGHGTLVLGADGSYTYTPLASVPNGTVDSFTYTMRDAEGDTSTATLTFTFTGDANLPTAGTTAASVDDDALGGGIASGTGDLADGNADGDNNQATFSGILPNNFGLDGPGVVTLANMNTLTATIGTELVTYGWNAGTNTLTATITGGARNGTALFTVVVTPSTGAYSLTLLDNVLHVAGSAENDALAALTYRVTDGDGSIATGTLNITFDDDTPTAVAPLAITVANSATAPTVTQWLDVDHNVANNYGADGGTVRFAPSLDGASSGLTSNFAPIIYDVVNDQTLVGMVGTTVIFTITLNPASGEYSVDMNGRIDSLTTIDFNNGGYNFVGGNNSWGGFIPIAETVGSPIDNNSNDLLLTPEVGGVNSGTINATANTGGVSSGASVGSGEVFRVDFVTDLRGNPADGAGNYDTAANRDHLFDGHYTAQGTSALFKSSGGTTINIAAYDDPDGNNIVGDGVIDTIRSISISYLGVTGSLIAVTTTATNYTINGHLFTVQLMADGSVNVAGVAGASGSSLAGTVIATFTDNGYNSIEYRWVSGDTFQIGDFGATTQTTNPVVFNVPVEVIDGDGDISASSNLTVTANYVPPIVIDLDGDGVEFAPLAAGVTFDYAGDGTPGGTAWAGGDDGLLAIDLNGDGIVNDGSEIVFGGNGLTDLQGLAITYDSNHDGVLSASDTAFAQFGVWQDANSNGVTDAGEFNSLVELGITSIDLVSDGVSYTAADGDVVVHGTGSFSWADGTSGTLADASFATSALDRVNARIGEMVATAAATTGLLAAIAATAMPLAAAAHEAGASGTGLESGGDANFNLQSVKSGIIENLSLKANFFDASSAQTVARTDSGSVGNEHGPAAAELAIAIDHGLSDGKIADLAGGDNAAVAGASDLIASNANSIEAMDALLSMQAPVASKVAAIASDDLPAIQEAFADTAANHAVDSIVEHFAAGSLGEGGMPHGGDDFALIGLLDSPVQGLSQSVSSPFEMAFLLDHQDTAAMA